MKRRSRDGDDDEIDGEPQRSPHSSDVFEDHHEADPDEADFMPSVSDGFSPTNMADAVHTNWPIFGDAPQRDTSTSNTPASGTPLRWTATRNSVAKMQDSMGPDSRLHDRRPPSAPPSPRPRDSISSAGSFATTSHSETPFTLGTGPSHPYAMYTQHTQHTRHSQHFTARPASSIATAPTSPLPHRSLSLHRPTHPYAMYSQSGLADEEPPEPVEIARPQNIRPDLPPVQTALGQAGFPGLGAGYHRVLGPDGEEQDIIGPDGHTEQLPPYTRYPEAGPTKASMAAELSASRSVPAPVPTPVTAPVSAVDSDDPFATPVSPSLPPSRTSVSTPVPSTVVPALLPVVPARLPPQRPETQTGNAAPVTSAAAYTIPAEPSDSSSASLLATEKSDPSEKVDPDHVKPCWRQRKIWGKVPAWVAVAVLVLLLILAIAMGVAIGTALAKKHRSDHEESENPTPYDHPLSQIKGPNGSLFDAVPIPPPPGLLPLPTGAFALPLGMPQESNQGCLTQANQVSAWSCKMTLAPLIITINETSEIAGCDNVVSIQQGTAVPGRAILYGLQTPELKLLPADLVMDLDYQAYGPAHHFKTRYDKLVILKNEELSVVQGSAKRRDNSGLRQQFVVKPGDNPWYCFWNETYIEGYIYSQDNSSAALYNLASSASLSSPILNPSDTAMTATTATLALTGSPQPRSTESYPASSTQAAPPTPSPLSRRDSASAADPGAPTRMPPYPRIVKMEERRLPNSPPPYCQKMVLLDNGDITAAPDGNNSPLRVWLQEQDPTYPEYSATSPHADRRRDKEAAVPLVKRTDPQDSCHCQWMFD